MGSLLIVFGNTESTITAKKLKYILRINNKLKESLDIHSKLGKFFEHNTSRHSRLENC